MSERPMSHVDMHLTRVPLTWRDDQTGYQCPYCGLYVCVPQGNWVVCPRCPGIDIEETADLLLAERTGLDESERADAVSALAPLLNALCAAVKEAHDD